MRNRPKSSSPTYAQSNLKKINRLMMPILSKACGRLWTRLLQEFLDLGFFRFHQLHRGHGNQITIAIGLEP